MDTRSVFERSLGAPRAGFALPETIPATGPGYTLRARACKGEDDPGPRVVATLPDRFGGATIFWLPCRDDGGDASTVAGTLGVTLYGEVEHYEEPAAGAPYGEITAQRGSSDPRHDDGISLIQLGYADDAIVVVSSSPIFGPTALPALRQLHDLARTIYPAPRKARRLARQATARIGKRLAWAAEHRAKAVAAFARGLDATALLHLGAERGLRTGDPRPLIAYRGPLPAMIDARTHVDVALAVVAARLERAGFTLRATATLDPVVAEAFTGQVHAILPWLTLDAPDAPVVLGLAIDRAGLTAEARTDRRTGSHQETIYGDAPTTSASQDAARARIAELDAAIEEVERQSAALPSTRTTYTKPTREGVGPQGQHQECTPNPSGVGETCVRVETGLYNMKGGVRTEDPSADARRDLARVRELLQAERRELVAAIANEPPAARPIVSQRWVTSEYTVEGLALTGTIDIAARLVVGGRAIFEHHSTLQSSGFEDEGHDVDAALRKRWSTHDEGLRDALAKHIRSGCARAPAPRGDDEAARHDGEIREYLLCANDAGGNRDRLLDQFDIKPPKELVGPGIDLPEVEATTPLQ